jgi:hypothetical protein
MFRRPMSCDNECVGGEFRGGGDVLETGTCGRGACGGLVEGPTSPMPWYTAGGPCG